MSDYDKIRLMLMIAAIDHLISNMGDFIAHGRESQHNDLLDNLYELKDYFQGYFS